MSEETMLTKEDIKKWSGKWLDKPPIAVNPDDAPVIVAPSWSERIPTSWRSTCFVCLGGVALSPHDKPIMLENPNMKVACEDCFLKHQNARN
jgi:hypothetical protein